MPISSMRNRGRSLRTGTEASDLPPVSGKASTHPGAALLHTLAQLDLPRARGVAFILMLLSALVGQFYFARFPQYLWDGVLFYGVSALCLAFLARKKVPAPGSHRDLPRAATVALRFLETNRYRALLWASALVSATVLAVQLRSLPEGADHFPLIPVWLLSVVAFILGSYPPPFRRRIRLAPAARALLPRKVPVEAAVVALVLFAAFLLRWTDLETVPANFGGDEGSQGLAARAFLGGSARNVFGVGWFAVPNLFFVVQAISMRLFGDDVSGVRMLSVLLGTASVAFCYLLVKRVLGIGTALAASVLLATYHFNIHFSRLASAQIGDALFVLAVLYFLLKALDSGGRAWFTACGVMLGLTQYFYFGARLVPVIVVAYLAYFLARERPTLKAHARGLIQMVVVAWLVALPYLAYCSGHPGTYFARVNQVGIFQSGWYDRAVALNPDPAAVLGEQALRSVLAFNLFPDKTYWYHPGIPLLDFFSSIFFCLGLLVVTAGMRHGRFFLLGLSFWLGIVFGGFLTENPPSSMRLVILSPFASIFVAVGMRTVVDIAGELFRLASGRRAVLLASLVLVASVSSVVFYFGEYSRHRTEGYGGPNTEVATEIGRYLRTIDGDKRVYFFGAPRMYINFASIPFLDPGLRGIDVTPPVSGAPGFVGAEDHSVLIFLPERVGELELARGYLPAGTMEEVRGESGRLLFVSYRVDR